VVGRESVVFSRDCWACGDFQSKTVHSEGGVRREYTNSSAAGMGACHRTGLGSMRAGFAKA
jgi:hypothetical protein